MDQARKDALTKSLADQGVDATTADVLANEQVNQGPLSLWTHGKRAVDYAVTALEHPSAIVHSTIQSVPLMLAGGAMGRVIGEAIGPLAKTAERAAEWGGALGEGVSSYFAQREQVRQDLGTGALARAEAAMLASGFGTTLFSRFGAALAQKFGVADIDTLMAAAHKSPSAKTSLLKILKSVPAAMIQEGVAEELPQGIQEQCWQNVAEGKPWYDGMADNALMGMFSGMLMGAHAQAVEGAGVLTSRKPSVSTVRRFCRISSDRKRSRRSIACWIVGKSCRLADRVMRRARRT